MTDAGNAWRGRPVAVTGASGFLGSHLTRVLVEQGAAVVVLVRDEVPRTPIIDSWMGRVSVVRGDLCDMETMERMLGEYDVETLFHLAAQSQVGVANRNPASTFESNIKGTWSLLEAARRSTQLRSIVVASSDKAYGDQPALPYTEDMPLLARHPYDVSKACADMLATSYATTFATPVAITRCGNLFGPGDLNWQRLVPGTIRSFIVGEQPIIRSDGTLTRDYLHVEDAAYAYLRVAEALEQQPDLAGRAFNFATETPLSVLELFEMIRSAAGSTLEPKVLNTAKGEIQHQYLSAALARETLGWKPRYDVPTGVAQTVAWYQDFLRDPG